MSRGGQRKSIDGLTSRRAGKSTTLLIPAWEQICDDILSPSRRLELELDFAAESEIAPSPYTYARRSPTAPATGKFKRGHTTPVFKPSPLRIHQHGTTLGGRDGGSDGSVGGQIISTGTAMTATTTTEKSRVSKSSSGSRRILRNIPTIKGGVWNALTMRMPKITFVKRFESVDTLRG